MLLLSMMNKEMISFANNNYANHPLFKVECQMQII